MEKTTTQRLFSWFDDRIHIVFIIPAMAVLLGLVVYPLFFNVNLSLHKVNMLNFTSSNWKFVGLDNFIKTLGDKTVTDALVRTFVFMLVTVSGQLVLGMIGALTLNTALKGRGLLTVVVLIPMMMTPVAVGLFWRMLLNNQWGIINYFLSLFGIDAIPWLSQSTFAFISVCMVQIWWGVSFVMLVLLGGLSALPPEPFEAAQVDGAGRWRSFTLITLPSLSPVISIVVMLRAIDAFREFDIIYTLTQGGPGVSTRVFSLQLYLTSFESQDFSTGAAQALILTTITLLLASRLIRSMSGESNG
ncbi:MAG: sugar ABC transporter permease [Sphaerochaeta associata]|uniref:carbohydrate ABC transporter permease n=1 Tax=Sphaerochaeta associata TaxID=1129264 RepID=UPI002B20BA08|nr:sugar ABC transporter permease [Sphaerochaeta associata]MEA5108662.1 sugar ABC transporter permease [Sphaerochaeta associata]